MRSPRVWTLTGQRRRTGTDSAWTTPSTWPGTWPGSLPPHTSCSRQTLSSTRGNDAVQKNYLKLNSAYFSPNLIKDFLAMVKRNPKELQRKQPRVFVNSIFEIAANHSLPDNKSELVSLLNSSTVIPFHKTVCPQCHKIPKALVSKHQLIFS